MYEKHQYFLKFNFYMTDHPQVYGCCNIDQGRPTETISLDS